MLLYDIYETMFYLRANIEDYINITTITVKNLIFNLEYLKSEIIYSVNQIFCYKVIDYLIMPSSTMIPTTIQPTTTIQTTTSIPTTTTQIPTTTTQIPTTTSIPTTTQIPTTTYNPVSRYTQFSSMDQDGQTLVDSASGKTLESCRIECDTNDECGGIIYYNTGRCVTIKDNPNMYTNNGSNIYMKPKIKKYMDWHGNTCADTAVNSSGWSNCITNGTPEKNNKCMTSPTYYYDPCYDDTRRNSPYLKSINPPAPNITTIKEYGKDSYWKQPYGYYMGYYNPY